MENIKIAINSNCELIATPPEFITSQDSYYLEFIYNPSINPEDTMKISNNRDYYQQELYEDGLYVYHFIEMPAKHALISPDEYPDLYYDEDSGEIMLDNKVADLNTIISRYTSNSTISTGEIKYIEIPIFSICKLKNCILNIQKHNLINCKSNKCTSPIDDVNGFLFISLYVLEALISEGKYAEADEILSAVNTCNLVCKNRSTKKCNCNG